MGELLICPICMDHLMVSAVTIDLGLAPPVTRPVASGLAVTAASNALHHGWTALKSSEV